MQKKKAFSGKKLALKKETLVNMDSANLSYIKGGILVTPTITCPRTVSIA